MTKRSRTDRRTAAPRSLRPHKPAVWLALAAFAVAATTVASVAQSGIATGIVLADADYDRYPNFDIRRIADDPQFKDKEAALAYLERHAPAPELAEMRTLARATGLAALEAAVQGVDIDKHPDLAATETVSAMPGTAFLTSAATDREAAFRGYLEQYAAAYGLSASQVADLAVVADYENPAGNMSWVEFEQRFNGIPVFQGLLRGGFTAKGELARTTGVLATNIDEGSLVTIPSLGAAQAVALAATSVGWKVAETDLVEQPSASANSVTFDRGPMAGDAKAWLVYFPLADGVARLAWATQIIGDPYGFLTVVDAADGTMLFRKNLTNFQTQSASYTVYPSDSPAPWSPTTVVPGAGTQAPYVGRSTFTLIGNEAPNTFNNLGWMTDGTNETAGNNVRAGLDLVSPDGIESTVAGVNRVFNFTYNPETDAPSTAGYRNGEVADMFYWSNRYHDSLYLLGFTEPARNFQDNNFGRGGVGTDHVRAEGQDFSGTNNANFLTPADGTSGRMQMFIFPGPTPDRSSTLDHDVLIHELTHGTSNRLHNNGSGLNATMSGGMGEGWSDFYARALLAEMAEDVNGVYTTGGWLTNLITTGYTDNYYYGIRRFPYAVMSTTGGPMNRPHNPLTFADIDPAQINLTDGAYPRGPIGSNTAFQVHNIGEVWASALNEVRARFIARLGFATGNQRILQFVTDGMKLDPINPTLLQGRDSIIAAANAGGGTTADIGDIWAGFAVRGMGVSAQATSSSSGTVVEAFDTPGIAAGTATLVSEGMPNGRIDPGETVGVSFCIVNNGSATSGAVTGTLMATGGVTSPSAAQGYGAIAPGASVCRTYTFTASATCGATITATLQADESGAPTRNLVYSLLVGTLASFFTENFDGVTAPALPAGWTTSTLSGTANLWVTNTTTPDTAPNRAFAGDPSSVSDNVLVTPTIAIPAGSAAQLEFRNNFDTETGFDGGVLEISTAGGAFQDIVTAGGSFVSGGYTGVLSTGFGNPLPGRNAWTGTSGGYITTVVNLPASASGQSVQLRWRMGSDSSVPGVGWAIDSVVLRQATCTGGGGSVPTTNNDTYGTAFNTALAVPAPGVLGNDNTNGGGAMTALKTSDPANGLLSFNADGSFTYTPNGGFAGMDSFTYRAVNSIGQGNIATVTVTVSTPTTVQPPTGLYADWIGANVVRLRWTGPTSGPAPDGFALEGGINPGQVLASIPTGSAAPVYTFVAPTGSFYVRIHSLLGATRSGASNEIQIHVNVPVAPSAPSGLLGLVNGNALGLAWKNTYAGGPISNIVLDVTGSIVTSIPLGAVDSFAFVGVPAGTYNLSLRAVNGAGSSPASNPVTLTFPGPCSGAPQVPTNLLGYRIGNTAFAQWDPPAAGPAPGSYVLNVTGSFVGSIPTTGRALSGVVGPGTYNISVVAVNACGTSPASPVQVITVP